MTYVRRKRVRFVRVEAAWVAVAPVLRVPPQSRLLRSAGH